jgi:hypothetical protein
MKERLYVYCHGRGGMLKLTSFSQQLYSQLRPQLGWKLRSDISWQLLSQLNSQLYSQLYSQLDILKEECSHEVD